MTRPELVTYDGLPAASGGAHGLRVRRAATAHAGVDAFLSTCVEPIGAVSRTFRVWAGGPEHRSAHWRELAASVLGGPRRTDRTHSNGTCEMTGSTRCWLPSTPRHPWT